MKKITSFVFAAVMMLGGWNLSVATETGQPLSISTNKDGVVTANVAIDLTNATVQVTGADTIRLEGVAALGSHYWINMQWNINGNAFAVTSYGEEAVTCGGWMWNNACWYTAPAVGMSCNQVCANYGGFDVAGSTHVGNDVGRHFWPNKADGSNWVSVECSSTDNNTNWGADGSTPDGDFTHAACYVNCACNK